MSDAQIETLRGVYAAFGRGDLDTILAELADEVDWVSVSEEANRVVPWYGRYRGRGDVPRFFKEIGSTVDGKIAFVRTCEDTEKTVAAFESPGA